MGEKFSILILGFSMFFIVCCKSGIRSSNLLSINAKDAMGNGICPSVRIKSIVNLETNDSILIGSVTRMEFCSEKYFIFDRDYSKALFIFNSEGKFIAKTKYGRGPGEILAPWDFFIDNQNSHILIWDQAIFRMIVYDMNLKFISNESHLDLAIRNFKFIDTDTAFVFAQSPVIAEIKENTKPICYNYLIYTDNFNKVTQKISPTLSELVPLTLNSPISFNNGIIYIAPLDYFVYKLKNNEVIPIYHLDFGTYQVSKDDVKKGIDFIFSKVRTGQKIGSLDYVFENEKYFAVSFFFKNRRQFIIYSKLSNKTYYSDNLFKNKLLPICLLQGIDGDNFIGVIDPTDFIKYTTTYKSIPAKTSLSKISDNPYLIVFNIED
jgi:hypothetical protein